MIVRLSGGPGALIEPLMMIFTNTHSNYPIRGLQDDKPGVCYRTGPKGGIYITKMIECVKESRAIIHLLNGRKIVLLMDYFRSHGLTDDLRAELEKKGTEIRFLPANANDLVQPADLFVIQKTKAAWLEKWERRGSLKMHTLRLIAQNCTAQ